MQTWARRGVQAALVTGGMLAAGTGVAAASGNCPDRPTSPLGDPLTPAEAAGDGTPSRSGLCFAGELFPEDGKDPLRDTVANATADTLVGVIEPIRDVPPEVDNERTQRIPRITDAPEPDVERTVERTAQQTAQQHWIPPRAESTERLPVEPPRSGPSTGLPELSWRTDVARSAPLGTTDRVEAQPRERSRGRHAAQETKPADGFHRSLSWSGPIGGVVDTLVDARKRVDAQPHVDESTTETLPLALVTPHTDPAVAPELAAPRGEGIVQAGPAARSRNSPGLLLTDSIDLTSSGLDTGPDLRAVPRELLRSALSASSGVERPAEDAEPLRLPNEAHQRAEQVPTLVAPELLVATPDSTNGPDGAELVEPLGEFNAFDGNVETGGFSRIARELSIEATTVIPAYEAEEDEVFFSERPELSRVVVRELDELAAAMPERQQVASNPFRERPTARGAAPATMMALPLLDGHTYPLPALDADGMPKVGAV
ncbi:hypothetical protein SAMN04487819_12024 [Actinopolyspora alba]|uniref:Secreted protein n=1 Tax=Actinopolyspora alba TaxID=673379 RepID=A0A1I2C9J0_9ACTN|nr:hypothetical protein [Actinopolyspora alba]SFE64996.1 hypothetical protein SAMN04487819_12024 [Actinopolyspora alba]